MNDLKDEDAIDLIESYESWTAYKYPDPKNFQFISKLS